MNDGPYFDELTVGQVFDAAPALTLTSGAAAVHQSITGDRLRLACDAHLAAAVTGEPAPPAHPGLVWDVAIGQSTVATRRVKANLFYRGLTFHRFPLIGDTLSSHTEVVGLRPNSPRPDRPPTGLAALRVTTTTHTGHLVLDFYRCAMLPGSPGWQPGSDPGDDLSRIGAGSASSDPYATAGWDAAAFRDRVPGPYFDPTLVGAVLHSSADVVSGAPELARLTMNIAAVHHDHRIGGRRLVYGGHTIGLALAQATRLLPNLVTVLGWASCDHTGPVYEGDTVYSTLQIESAHEHMLGLRSLVYAVGDPDRQVLDWRFTALHF